MSARSAVLAAVWLAAAVTACDHTATFAPGSYTPNGPFGSGPALRLTYNPGTDLSPLWLPAGGEILYTAERVDRADHDHCFAIMPSGGGTIMRYACPTTAANDSIDAFDGGALAPDGRIAYVRASSPRLPAPPIVPEVEGLVVAPLANPSNAIELRSLDYTAPSGRLHQGISHIGWLSPTRLVYLGERVTYPQACSGCAPDTVPTGIEITTLDFSGATPVLAIVPGTDSASSVAVGGTGDTIYFTRNGDSRVYRYTFSSGQTDTIHDFSPIGIARDVGVSAGRLVAIVGGDVTYVVDTVLGASQLDRGGEIHVVTLSSGAETVIGNITSRFRRPALSADGTRIVVEERTSGRSDLWLLNVP
ncbi:MAG TPA: hypothetical protein VGQ18_01915 [Gemmatimonadales bacterium]|jgi:hypothetical protein|nr:hypothetical protein [Gemmatimonadales bacterium]